MSNQKNKLVIARKPPPPALDPFECVICEQMIDRDPYRPEIEESPVCFQCSIRAPRTQLSGVSVSDWKYFMRASAIFTALKKETSHARRIN